MNIPIELVAVLLAAILGVTGFSLKILWSLSERVTKLEEHWQYLPWLMMSAGRHPDANAGKFPSPSNPKPKHEPQTKNQIHPQFTPLPGSAD
jgi:hypothetical protein